MAFTALHRLLGQPPSEVTDELVTAAVNQGISETDDLDWKAKLPPAKALNESEFPKDVAAMANSGGGLIVYGVEESEKHATGRSDVGTLSEVHERALRSAAITAISPPVFNLGVHLLGKPGAQAVAVEVPASIDVPHLVYRNEYFGAPRRNDADTVWMRERDVEAMYRARLEERRHAADNLNALYDEMAVGRCTSDRAWLIGVARPRLPAVGAQRPTREDAAGIFKRTEEHALTYATRGGTHPLENVDCLNPRPGLRRWTAVNAVDIERSPWRETWMSIHHDGAVSLATAVGGWPTRGPEIDPGGRINSMCVEFGVADLMALIRSVSDGNGIEEFELRVGLEWTGEGPLIIQTKDGSGYAFDGTSVPLTRYTPVDTTIRARADDVDFLEQVNELALDCVNQGGITYLQVTNDVVSGSR